MIAILISRHKIADDVHSCSYIGEKKTTVHKVIQRLLKEAISIECKWYFVTKIF